MERVDETDYDAIISANPPSIQAFGEALRQASRFGNVQQFTRLIDWGIPLFGLISINWRENGGFSALDCAAANGHVEIVRVLARLGGSQLSNTADDFSGMTPLLWAAHAGHWRCIEELCKNYSNLDVMDRNGQTALHIACREHHHDLARVLLEHKCDPNLKEDVMVRAHELDMRDLVSLAALAATLVVHTRVVAASRVSAAHEGKTAIHMVSGTGDQKMCELLLSQHADVNIVDNEGNTPIYIAAQEGHKELRELLLSYNREQPHLSTGLANLDLEARAAAYIAENC